MSRSLARPTANHPIASGQIHVTEPVEATMAPAAVNASMAHAAAVNAYLSNNNDFVSIRKSITDLLAAPPDGQRRYGSAYKQYKQTMALFNIAHRLNLSEKHSTVTVTVDGGVVQISWDDVAAWLPDLPPSYKNIRTKVIKVSPFRTHAIHYELILRKCARRCGNFRCGWTASLRATGRIGAGSTKRTLSLTRLSFCCQMVLSLKLTLSLIILHHSQWMGCPYVSRHLLKNTISLSLV